VKKLFGELVQHQMALKLAMQRFNAHRFANFFTLLGIAVSLTLPSFLWLTVKNAENIRGTWQESTQVSLFLKNDVDQEKTQQLIKKLESYPQVAYLNYISKEQGLQLLEEQSGSIDLLKKLESNPLPAVVELFPKSEFDRPDAIERLNQSLQELPEVALVKLDMQWVKRLNAMFALLKNSLYLIAGLLAMAVLLTISNTIRLLIESYKKEIEVLKLIGATNQFIERPFLYYGMLFGLFGAMLASLIVWGIGAWVGDMTQAIAKLYYSNFHFFGLNLKYGMIIAMIGMMLGFIGAKVAVNQQVKAIDLTIC
jgi:cell division transport system permease protein